MVVAHNGNCTHRQATIADAIPVASNVGSCPPSPELVVRVGDRDNTLAETILNDVATDGRLLIIRPLVVQPVIGDSECGGHFADIQEVTGVPFGIVVRSEGGRDSVLRKSRERLCGEVTPRDHIPGAPATYDPPTSCRWSYGRHMQRP